VEELAQRDSGGKNWICGWLITSANSVTPFCSKIGRKQCGEPALIAAIGRAQVAGRSGALVGGWRLSLSVGAGLILMPESSFPS